MNDIFYKNLIDFTASDLLFISAVYWFWYILLRFILNCIDLIFDDLKNRGNKK